MAAASASSPTPDASSFAAPPQVVAASGLEPHIASAICYTPFLIGLIASIIFLVAAPYNQNKFVRFSAFQSLFLHLACFLIGIVVNIMFGILFAIIHIFAAMLFPLGLLLWLAMIAIFLFMMYKSFNNQKVKLPFIGDLADKQA